MKTKARQFLVLGMGRFGTSVAKTLCQMGHEVLVVDSDQDIIDEIAPFVTQAICADVTDEDVIDSLGVQDFDTAVISMGDNIRDSVLVALMLKERGVPCVVSKASDDLHAKVLTKVGVDRVVFPERDMGARVAKWLVSPHVFELMNLSGEISLHRIAIPASWAGRTIGQIDVRRRFSVNILTLQRGEETIVSPAADTHFEPGDTVLILGKDADLEHVESQE